MLSVHSKKEYYSFWISQHGKRFHNLACMAGTYRGRGRGKNEYPQECEGYFYICPSLVLPFYFNCLTGSLFTMLNSIMTLKQTVVVKWGHETLKWFVWCSDADKSPLQLFCQTKTTIWETRYWKVSWRHETQPSSMIPPTESLIIIVSKVSNISWT